MASLELFCDLLFPAEGDVSNHPADKGKLTNMGVTLATWKSQGYDKDLDGDIDAKDLLLITHQDVIDRIIKPRWNLWHADRINNQSIANLCVDWVYNSGMWGIKKPQEVLGLTPDGVVGAKTLAVINNGEPSEVFSKIWRARKQFFLDICKRDPSQLVFLKGWQNRLNKLKFKQQ
jgi:lysozyme family protein